MHRARSRRSDMQFDRQLWRRMFRLRGWLSGRSWCNCRLSVRAVRTNENAPTCDLAGSGAVKNLQGQMMPQHEKDGYGG